MSCGSEGGRELGREEGKRDRGREGWRGREKVEGGLLIQEAFSISLHPPSGTRVEADAGMERNKILS